MKHIYLLFASIGIALSVFGLSKMDLNDIDSTTYSKKKIIESKKRVSPPKKYRPLVLKPEEKDLSQAENSQNWLAEALLVPTITATKSVTVVGGGNPVPGSILEYTVAVANAGTDATAVSFTDILDNNLTLVSGSVKASPIAGDDAYTSIGNVGINVPSGSGLLVNDNSPTNEPITVTAVNTAGTSGTVTFNPNGSFTFTPNTGFSGNTTFSYTTTGSTSSLTGTGTVTITVTSPIWFVDIAATTSTNVGTLANPFKDWSDFAASNALSGATNPATNQTIFVYSGTYTGAATLKSGQKVLGAGATTTLADFAGITVPSHSSPTLPTTSGTKPNLTSAGTTITLGANNTLRGFDMGNSVKDIVGSSFITLTASEMALNGDGQALDLTSGSLTCTFTSISSNNSADKGISFSAINGTLTSTGGTTITNPVAQGIYMILNSSVNANYGNTSVTGSGNIGVQLGSAGSPTPTPTTTFGSLTITPDAGQQALVSNSNGGTITCTSGNINSRISLAGASASLKLNLNIELTSYTSDGNLQLSNTTGSFRINGTGTSGSGGSMSGITTAPSILLNNVSNVSINYFNIINAGKSCFSATNLSGTCTINNCSFSMGTGSSSAVGNDRRCVSVVNKDVALTLNVEGSTFNGNLTTSPDNNHGIAYETTTDAASSTIGTLNIKTSTFNKFNNYALYVTSTGAAVTDVGFQTSMTDYDPANGAFVGGAIHLWSLRSAKLKFNILNNTSLRTAGGLPIDIYTNNFDAGTDFALPSGKSLEGKMTGNTMTGGFGMQVLVKGKAQGVVEISNNILSNGLLTLQAVENTLEATTETARLDATVTGNTIAENLNSYGIDVLSGASSTTTYSSVINCVKISGNNINPRDAGGLGLIRFFTNGPNAGGGPNVIWLEGTNGTAESSLVNYWNNNSNTPTGVTSVGPTRVRDAGFGGTGNKVFKVAGTCLTPTNTAPARIAVEDYVKNDFSQADSIPTLVADKITKETYIEKSDEIKIKETKKSDNLTLIAYDNSVAAPTSGETVTVNGSGSGFSLPATKSTTIIFRATVSSAPSTCAISNTASVSGSNFTTVNSNTTTTNLIVPAPTAVTPSSATGICTEASVNLSATCASGTVNWYALAAPSTLLGNSASGANFSQSPTVNTTYQAACLVGGCESTRVSTGLITVNPLPTITVSASPGICEGATSFTIPYTATTGTPTTYSISGTGITSMTDASLPATPITVNLSSAATGSSYSYTLTVKNANGCVSSNVTGNVTVNSAPTITTQASPAICAGANSFTIPYTATTGTPTTYSISGTGITTVTNGSLTTSPIVVNLSSGASGSSISYTLTVRNAGGCTSSNVIGSVTVNPLPTLTKSASPAICAGTTSFTIPYTTTTGTPTTYSISGTGITTVTDAALPATPITVNLSSGASGSSISYTLTVKNANGCTSSNITGSVTVNSAPTASPSSNTPVCVENTLNLTSATATTYSWTGPNSFTSTVQNPSVSNVSIVAGGTYTLTVTNASGCTATATTPVVINSTSAPTSPTATPSNFTVAGTTTLTATGCNSPSTLTWYDSANSSVALPNNTPTISANKTFFARCTGTNTCASNPSTNVSVTYTPCVPLASSPGNVGINWTGLVSTDWNNPCNWNPKWVPDATNSAVVIDLKTNQPTISGTVLSVKLIYVNSGATLTVASGGTLNASSTTAVLTLQGGNLINDGTINLSGGGTSVGLAIGATASITNRGTIATNNLYGVSLQFGNLTFTNESTGIITGDFKANNNTLTLTNSGTINYGGGTYALSLGSAGSSVINTGTISVTAGSGISNPSGSTITNNACGKILMTGGAGLYENGGTTTNAGLIQLLNTYDFTNTGTFTNNGVVKANSVSGITNNRMVITNACPIFTLAGSNNYTVSGIFTDAGATTSAGTYTSVGNKFTANNTIPTGTQTLYAQVTNGTVSGACTFVVPFDFNNRKPTAVSISTTNICVGSNVTLSATCASGTVTWYGSAAGTSPLGTGGTFSYVPSAGTGQAFYAACETTNCNSGRTITSNFVNVNSTPPAPTVTLTSAATVCQPATLNLTASGCAGTITWSNFSTGTSLSISATGTYNVTATCTVSGCTSVTSTEINGLVINAPISANPSSDSPKCIGQTLSFNSASGMSSYAWLGPNSFTSSIQAPSISSVTSAASGTYTLTVTNGACSATATTAVLINSAATVTATPSNQTICSASPITTIAITGTGSSYSWTRNNTTAVTGIAASGSGDISGSLTNTTEAPVMVTFTITSLGSCSGTTATAIVVVNPIPTVVASTPSQSICSGTSITGITFNNPIPTALLAPDPSSDVTPTSPKEIQGVGFSSFVTGTIFNWTRDNTATVTGIPASGTGNISGGLTNTTASPITVTFTVTPSYANDGKTCTGTPITVTVTVNPNPIAPTITGAGTAFCSGSSTTLTASANPTYTSYAWQRSLTGIANPNSFTTFGGTAQTQVVTTSGVYRVIVGNQYNCFASDTTAVKFGDFVFNGSLAAGDAQQTGRMNRFATVTTCASPTAYPGNFTTTGARYYDSYTITNPTSAPVCATVGLSSYCGTTLFSAAYSGSFNPSDVSQNYLADHGSSFPGTSFYEVTIPANGTIVVVVHEVNPGTGCSGYNLRVDVPGATTAPTASSNSPICSGNTLNLTSTGTGSYSWTGPNSFTSTAQNPSISNATTLATGTYTVSITNSNGCVFNATTAVTVNANPTATASSNSPVCVGNTLNLTSGTAASYSWTGPNSFSSTVQNPSILNVTNAANGTYTLIAANGSCSTTSTASVTINALPVPNPSTDSPRCVGNTLSFSSVAGMTSYAWAGPNSFTSSIQAPSISNVTIVAGGTYILTVTNASGCSASATTAVTINQALPPTITPPTSLSVCSPSTLTLTASGCAGTVTWSQGAATGTSLTLSMVGTYSISATCTVNGCTSDASVAVTGLEIKAKPNAPTITPPTTLVVCSPSTLTLTASGCAGMITWSEGAATGTSLTLSTVGTYSVSATCTVNGCTSDASTAVTGLVIKAKPNAPIITPPTSLSVCLPSTLTLTASGCAGTVTWSEGAATGTSLTLSTVGTYSVSATCNVNSCTSDASLAVTGLEIKAKPNAPTITPPTTLVVCSPSTLTLTASGCAGTITWSEGAATGTSLTISTVGTYSISATCTVNGCTSDASTAVTGLEIKATPIITATNTGPYTVGQTISLTGTGAVSYNWTGPNNFSSTSSTPTIPNALSVNSGVYTLSVTGINGCNAVATTNVIVSGIDPCDPSRIVDYSYVKAGNPYQTLFPLTDGMVINQRTDQVSILVNPVCSSVAIESFEMNLQGPEMNWNILQNVSPYALFDNLGLDVWGRNLKPGVYTLTVTGYPQDNKVGVATYGPKVITFTIVGDLATINAPTLSKNVICAGSSVDVTFSTTGSFNGINQFQVELSDSSGSFAAPVLIGTTNTTGTLNCTIPQSTLEGSKYLIRVTSTNQVVASNPAMSLVTVHPFSYNLVSPTNNLTGTSTKKAVTTINASNKVTSPASVTYQAGNSILLTPGFESGAVFKAEIQGCNN